MLAVWALALSSTSAARANAQWGCEVLLCSVSANPGWQAIPYCVPPMTRLIRHLSEGGDWPACLSSDARLGYERWLPCRGGFRSARRNTSTNDDAASWPIEICRSQSSRRVCAVERDDGEARNVCRQVHEEYAREPHSKPYYYAIRGADGSLGRYHFSLSR